MKGRERTQNGTTQFRLEIKHERKFLEAVEKGLTS